MDTEYRKQSIAECAQHLLRAVLTDMDFLFAAWHLTKTDSRYFLVFNEFIKLIQVQNDHGGTCSHILGACYAAGYVVTRDYRLAVKWWSRAAKNGNKLAHHDLGIVYYYGVFGNTPNSAKAIQHWIQAQDYAPSQYELGLNAWKNCQVDVSLNWWLLAAKANYENAKLQLLRRFGIISK